MSYRLAQQLIEEENYRNDPRVRNRLPDGFDKDRMVIVYTVEECDCDKHEALLHPFWVAQVQEFSHWRANVWTEVRPGWEVGDWFVSVGPLPMELGIHASIEAAGLMDRLEGNRLRCTSADDAKAVYDDVLDHTCYEDDPDLTHVYEIACKWEVCPTCDGKGRHVSPSIDCNGLTQEDFDEDPYFEEEYFAGTYDVVCNHCKGRTTVPVPDEDRADPEALKAYYDHLRDMADMEAEYAAERRMGC